MGALTSRQNAGVEEVDIGSGHAYRYPPKTGNYFSSHFIMGGERFETPQPEAYLFGENSDLNFLGSRPTPVSKARRCLTGELHFEGPSSWLKFPYPAPQANEPTKTLKSLVNIRKESLRFVRAPERQISDPEPTGSNHGTGQGHGDDEDKSTHFNIEFVFDSDCHCAITIYYFCTEEVSSNGVTYIPRDPTMNSETYHYKRGVNQQFSQVSHMFDPSQYTEEELNYNPDKEIIPMAIQCVAEEGEEPHQSHTTIAVIEKHSDGTHVLKALKQKLFVDGLCYLLQEIYGIENKNSDSAKTASDEDTEDSGSECVICMCDVRDTLILPCRHLCLCNSCADSLRYQANNCPICRAPFRALLQVRALQKIQSLPLGIPPPEGVPDNIPVGYEAISLIEALNGPFQPQPLAPTHTIPIPSAPLEASTPTDSEGPARAAEVLNSIGPFPPRTTSPGSDETTPGHNATSAAGCTTPEICMSVMVSQEDSGKATPEPPSSPPAAPLASSRRGRGRDKSAFMARDTLTLISETKSPKVEEETDAEAEDSHSLLDAATSTSEQAAGAPSPHHRSVSVSVSPQALQQEEGEEGGQVVVAVTEATQEDEEEDEEEEGMGHVGEEAASTAGAVALNRCKPRSTQMSSKASTLTAEGGSLPGTPQSAASQGSQRSSGDSFSSTSSTRQLLPHPSQETLSEDKAVP